MATSATAAGGRLASTRMAWPQRAAIVVAIAVCLTASLGCASNKNDVTVLTGTAYVGAKEFTAIVDGWSYGTQTSVAWIDRQGSFHDSGWPSCLQAIGKKVRIKFGAVPVTAPDGTSWRQVVWVDCRY